MDGTTTVSELTTFLTPKEAWEQLVEIRTKYYKKYSAAYSGCRVNLNQTGSNGSFWKRRGKSKIHVPVAADIAAVSADLLFGEEPRFSCIHKGTEENETKQQQRLDELIKENGLHGLLNEAAEQCAALGDVYLKLNWREEMDHPTITIVPPDSALPEYMLGTLQCLHFFSILKVDRNKTVYRLYECYSRGKIKMAIFKGSQNDIGTEQDAAILEALGFAPEVTPPVNDMLGVHIPNIRPNRMDRSSMLGRSDFDGLRDLMDALDEVYSSWIRDVRLAKARTIVPADYLRKREGSDMFKEGEYTYEFDEDVETLVALDIDPDRTTGNQITLSQFNIRSQDHSATCTDLLRVIYTTAGYSPQTFGMDINGQAESGTALHIREKKSFNTRAKKQTYWKSPLEEIMTAMVHLDAALYAQEGSHADDTVSVRFADGMANDLSTVSASVQMLHNAEAISIDTKVKMLHPDWTQKQIEEEIQRIKDEYGEKLDPPNPAFGDFGSALKKQSQQQNDEENEESAEEDE